MLGHSVDMSKAVRPTLRLLDQKESNRGDGGVVAECGRIVGVGEPGGGAEFIKNHAAQLAMDEAVLPRNHMLAETDKAQAEHRATDRVKAVTAAADESGGPASAAVE